MTTIGGPRRLRRGLATLILVFATSGAWAQQYLLPESGGTHDPMLAEIRAEMLGAHIEFLASPALEGRSLGTRGLDAAMEYVVATLRIAGVGPLGVDGTYFQPVPLRRERNGKGKIVIVFADGTTKRRTAANVVPPARNVIAVVPGSDPALGDEAVVVGAHVDHIGRRHGKVVPGADDNASGVAALLELAKAFAGSPAKRTLVFAFWTAEEEGQFGSDWYVRHPRWPLGKTIAYVNLDTIGSAWTDAELRKVIEQDEPPNADEFLQKVRRSFFVEPGLPSGVPRLEEALRRSASETGLAMRLDWTDGKSGGSDYRAFARKDVPFLRLFGTYTPNYHEPTDTPSNLDFTQVERIAQFAFAAVRDLANGQP